MNAIVSEKTASEEVVGSQAASLGTRLQQARIANDLDITRMADRLHLTRAMVEAIERDDYSELPARVFVRGYVRNYARAVDMSAESVVAQFDLIWPEDDAPVRVDNAPRLPADSHSARHWARAITWLLVVIMVVLFLMWWQGYLGRFTQGLTSKGVAPAGQVETPAQPVVTAQPAPVTPAAPAPVTGSATLPLPRRPDSPKAAAGNNRAAAAAPEPQAAVAAPTAQVAPVDAAPVAQPEPASTASAAQPDISIRLSQPCWVSVRDSSGKFKWVGTMPKGTSKTLGGKPPYRMVFGNAAAVSVNVNGNAYDLAPYTKDNVARLTLNP